MDGTIGPGSDPDTAGFTLIELLVAVAVLAVLAVGASLAATRGSGGAEDAQRFADRFAALRQLAVQGQSPRGLQITPRGLRMVSRRDGVWQEDGQEVRWRGRVGFAPQEPPGSGDAPEIVFLSNGRTSAFSIRFGSGAGQLCRSDGWTGLTCDDA
ncbi:prepilin-type N-terminal cleavage/methylation domain-containing protein [Thalassococcus profundi]|uniref:Prepilin-type N-terminal cleavage/methylation domain-containing protein n=1 Tax=Thalassococcus profundi TaxID=2282382 RepID=A0A369TF87_9RHOB|nr:prepilin-type N-terminal cleavage/methylation domain-containing protein [Thalassococcus profundi]RDD64031.1 prepilin-type N-terminal cleavage/methylation domain-containing protein [Thalassococcus profundi]